MAKITLNADIRPNAADINYWRNRAPSGAHDTSSRTAVLDVCRQVREALDRGQPVPAEAGPHDVAATVLAFFAALPAPFMPTSAAQVCDVCVPSVRIGGQPYVMRLGAGSRSTFATNRRADDGQQTAASLIWAVYLHRETFVRLIREDRPTEDQSVRAHDLQALLRT